MRCPSVRYQLHSDGLEGSQQTSEAGVLRQQRRKKRTRRGDQVGGDVEGGCCGDGNATPQQDLAWIQKRHRCYGSR